MKVLIAGAGIGGLVTALGLHDAGINVEVHEAAREVRPLGVGINLLPHAMAYLDRLGVLEEISSLGVPTADLRYYNRHGQLIWAEPRGRSAGYPVPQVSVHRGRLQLALLDLVRRRLGTEAVRTGSRVVGFEGGKRGIDVQIEDRHTDERRSERVDLLVGADGIHSLVRKELHPGEGPPRWSGEMLWRATTTRQPFLGGRSMVMVGTRERKLVAYPITEPADDGSVIVNWIAVLDRPGVTEPGLDDWNRLGRLEDFAAEFESWTFDWLDVPGLLRDADATYEFPMVDRDPLPFWSAPGVTLLGDAAHPMYPIGSNGASQAILDGQALVIALRSSGDLDAALQRYEGERRPATARIVEANRSHGAAQVLDLAEDRAPDGFASVDDVFAPGELDAIAESYRGVAGFTQRQVEETLGRS